MMTDGSWLRRPGARALLLVAALLAAGPACVPGGEEDPQDPPAPTDPTDPNDPDDPDDPIEGDDDTQPTPPTGQTEFYSADGRNGQRTQEDNERGNNDAEDAGAAPDADGAGEERTVEEGDIYRVVEGAQDLILNLNSYRGFQIIDFTDVSAPEIIGHVQLSGTPVEMYQVGDRAYVLLNNWYSYWQSRHAPTPQRHHGGGVVVIDISDRAHPKITAQAHIDGWISSSRLTRGNGQEALYMVSREWQGGGQTNVKSFSVSEQGKLTAKSTLSLGGYVQDIQATPQRLLVSRYDYQQHRGRSKISIVDISSPTGEMVEGDSVLVKGQVDNKFNMDLHEGILRVASSNSWSSNTNTNHLETFDATDIQDLVPIDHDTYGDNEDLYATLFMGNKAFFVTYRRVDPFHAFEITDAGQATEKSEFIVSGWNDYFRAVSSRTRLIGIGKNDEGGRNTMAVSLYDITDLTNPSPMITRAEVDLDRSWSEAQWDDRAFSVLEKATSVPSPDGSVTETGLVLLPFSGWNETEQRYVSAVQIYTFSSDTLTLRGVMDHGSPVRRSFLADRTANTTANLSEAELSLFDTSSPDQPSELGRLELAPNYTGFTIFGDYGVRHHDRSDYYGWWGRRGQTQRSDSLQVVSLQDDVDRATPVATLDIPAHAQVHRAGDRLVTVSTNYEPPADGGDYEDGRHISDLEVWDLSDPTQPELVSSLQTERLESNRGHYGYWGDCWDCGYYYGYDRGPQAVAAGDALVFTEQVRQERLEGTEVRRTIRPSGEMRRHQRGCYSYDEEYQEHACTYLNGSIRCTQLTRTDGTVEGEVCTGKIFSCEQDGQGNNDCVEVDAADVQTEERIYDREKIRRWSSYELEILDLSDATQPTWKRLELPTDEEAVKLVADGATVHYNYKQPHDVAGDSRPYVRYHIKPIDLTDPSSPTIGAPINVPGELLVAQGDTLLTQDLLWGQKIIEASINKLELFEGQAFLQGVRRFVDQQVDQVLLDGAGHALVSHYKAWVANYEDSQGDWEDYDRTRRLSMLDVDAEGFDLLSETEVDDWATLKDARQGRALYQVPGGMLVLNLEDPADPHAQAYYPLRGWPRDVTVDGTDIYFSAGRYGLYTLGLDTQNLFVTEPAE